MTTVQPDSAAAKAGIKPGERIASVDAQPLDELGSTAVGFLLSGPVGTPSASR